MRGILILAHGSREKSTEQTLQQVVKYLGEIFSEEIIETAYLQFSNLDLHTGLEKLRAKGVDNIIVIPYFLFEGVHIKEDIPKEIDKYLKENKDVKITMGKTLGADKRLAEILADRIRDAL
ncbi:CbiX/SirB N-terminal domain-containing protein [Defluviitalea saccharophila]|jgi:sirohydrochlorin ferrochelatase|uniref:CbiX/SirB N-terminal domain-containing protein n=1 Tax=Defluviitalea saccharophila TaxID=879970 RepID=A0ABZ2Y5L0_9FIRM